MYSILIPPIRFKSVMSRHRLSLRQLFRGTRRSGPLLPPLTLETFAVRSIHGDEPRRDELKSTPVLELCK